MTWNWSAAVYIHRNDQIKCSPRMHTVLNKHRKHVQYAVTRSRCSIKAISKSKRSTQSDGSTLSLERTAL